MTKKRKEQPAPPPPDPEPEPTIELHTTPARHTVTIKDGQTYLHRKEYGVTSEEVPRTLTLSRNEGSTIVGVGGSGFPEFEAALLSEAFTTLMGARA